MIVFKAVSTLNEFYLNLYISARCVLDGYGVYLEAMLKWLSNLIKLVKVTLIINRISVDQFVENEERWFKRNFLFLEDFQAMSSFNVLLKDVEIFEDGESQGACLRLSIKSEVIS